LIIIGGLNKT